jgi:hypothetical protein
VEGRERGQGFRLEVERKRHLRLMRGSATTRCALMAGQTIGSGSLGGSEEGGGVATPGFLSRR